MSTKSNIKVDSPMEILPFEIGYLSEFFQQKAAVELNESPENIEKGLRELRKLANEDMPTAGHWMQFKGDEAFEGLRINLEESIYDEYGIWFLRYRKYDANRAFLCVKAFVKLMKNHPEWFTEVKFETILPGPRDSSLTFLPLRCPDGCAILRVELDRWDPKEVLIEDVKRNIVLSLWNALRDPMTQVNGFKVIFNVKCNPLKYIRFCTPANIIMLYHGTQVCTPARFKEYHIVGMSLAFKLAWFIAKPFLSAKLKKRFIFHSGPETLQDHFPRSVLPTEYGGDLENLDMSEWYRKITQSNLLHKMVSSALGIS